MSQLFWVGEEKELMIHWVRKVTFQRVILLNFEWKKSFH